MIKLTGNVIVNPKRPGDFRKNHKLKTVIVEFKGMGLAHYYINMLERKYGPWMNLSPPMFGLHVTLVKGTETFNEQAAYDFQEKFKTLTLDIDPTTLARTDWSKTQPGFWTMKVAGDLVPSFRRDLRVNADRFGLRPHLTVARENGVFFMPTRTPGHHELSALVEQALTLIPVRGGNHSLIADLGKFKKLCGTKLVTGHDLIKLIHEHLNFPTVRKAAPAGQENWEQEVLNLFKWKG